MKIYLVGHRAPDLDATTGPVAYAEYLEKTKRYPGAEIVPVVCDGVNKESEMIFKKYGAVLPEKLSIDAITEEDRIILIDHNEDDQRMEGLDPTKVIEIVDHHKIKINFSSPIRIDVRPFGSVSSVIYENFVKDHIEPSKKTAELILASILSDTQGLKSTTTTGFDALFAESLAEKTGEDIEKLTFEIFKAKSDISGMSPEEIVMKDYKIFDFNGKKVFIGQIETVEPEKILGHHGIGGMKESILKAMDEVKAKEDVGLLFLVVTDVLKINSHMLYITDEEKSIAERAYEGAGEDNIINIGPRMSRKKDIAPQIERVLSEKE